VYWVRVSDLDRLVHGLMEKGFYVCRHSYSYRIFYQGKIVAGLHLYPGYREASLRLYRVYSDLAGEALKPILEVIRKVFPEYTIDIKWYPP